MKNSLVLLSILILLAGCIGDDIILDTIDEKVVITNPIDSLELNATHSFSARFLNQIGEPESKTIQWSSSDPMVLEINADGLATGLQVGTAEVSATVALEGKDPVSALMNITVATTVESPGELSRSGSLRTTSTYALSGDFILKTEDGSLILELADNYQASTSLPGLYVYLTNNPNTTSNALELSKVSVFAGTHTYAIPADVELATYSHLLYFCKPFGVKVGDGAFDN